MIYLIINATAPLLHFYMLKINKKLPHLNTSVVECETKNYPN